MSQPELTPMVPAGELEELEHRLGDVLPSALPSVGPLRDLTLLCPPGPGNTRNPTSELTTHLPRRSSFRGENTTSLSSATTSDQQPRIATKGTTGYTQRANCAGW